MINILIIGAKLQGVEAMYLAKKAGYCVTVVDHHENAPGRKLADKFIKADVFDGDVMLALFRSVDIVLPVIEDIKVLSKIMEYGKSTGKKVIFDFDAYEISSSKDKSNELFRKKSLPVPREYPECGFPVILKPNSESGSKNVKKAYSRREVDEYLLKHAESKMLIQEYITGRSYSLEVIGDGQNYYFPQITEVVVDEKYDCMRIIAPALIEPMEKKQMLDIGKKLAKSLKIKGIFDIEVMSDNGRFKLLEIDARLPSQTPISVYHSTGMNMVEMMVELAIGNKEIRILPEKQVCMYQQIQVSDGKIEVAGEHIMGTCRGLKIKKNFFGSTEAITDYSEGSHDWKGIIIVTGETYQKAEKQFDFFIEEMKKGTGIESWEFIERRGA